MHSRTICRTASPDIDARQAAVAELEQALWADGFDESVLERYQAAHRALEQSIAETGTDDRHRFLVEQGFAWGRFEEPRDGWKRTYWRVR